MAYPTDQDLQDAKTDIDNLEAFANDTGTVTLRSPATTIKTMRQYATDFDGEISTAQAWASKTDTPVITSPSNEYSAREYAQGSQASTGGSAKNWAQETGGDVTGASANSKSAKSWAQENLTGATLGGSSKDWAQTAEDTPVDGVSGYSSFHWSEKSRAYYELIRAQYLGAQASDPSVDLNGDALTAGDWYFNTTSGKVRIYDGVGWSNAIDGATEGADNTWTGANEFARSLSVLDDTSSAPQVLRWSWDGVNGSATGTAELTSRDIARFGAGAKITNQLPNPNAEGGTPGADMGAGEPTGWTCRPDGVSGMNPGSTWSKGTEDGLAYYEVELDNSSNGSDASTYIRLCPAGVVPATNGAPKVFAAAFKLQSGAFGSGAVTFDFLQYDSGDGFLSGTPNNQVSSFVDGTRRAAGFVITPDEANCASVVPQIEVDVPAGATFTLRLYAPITYDGDEIFTDFSLPASGETGASEAYPAVLSGAPDGAYFDGKKLSRPVDTVSEMEALTTRHCGAGDTIELRGYHAAGDAGGGHFTVLAGSASSNGMSANGVHVFENDDADLTFVRNAPERYIALPWAGARANVVFNDAGGGVTEVDQSASTDDKAAFDRAFDYARSIIGGAGNENDESLPVIIDGMGLQYWVDGSADATFIRARAWQIKDMDVVFTGSTSVGFDLVHSREPRISNVTVRGDEATPPRRGFQVGYLGSAATSAGQMHLESVFTNGRFTEAGFYNGGSEENTFEEGQLRNQIEDDNAYEAILDSCNWWGRRCDGIAKTANHNLINRDITGIVKTDSTTLTVTTDGDHYYTTGWDVRFGYIAGMTELNGEYHEITVTGSNTFTITVADTTAYTNYSSGGEVWRVANYSFVMHRFSSVAFTRSGGKGHAVWIGFSCDEPIFDTCYFNVQSDTSDNRVAPIVMAMNPSVDSRGFSMPKFIHALGETKSSVSELIYFKDEGSTPASQAISGFEMTTHKFNGDNAIIKGDAAGGGQLIEFYGAKIDISNIEGGESTTGWFDPPGRFRLIGSNITTRAPSATGAGDTPVKSLPEMIGGELTLRDAEYAELPEGSYQINAPLLDGSDGSPRVYMKGAYRFVGGDESISKDTLASLKYVRLENGTLYLPAYTSENPTVGVGALFLRDKRLQYIDDDFARKTVLDSGSTFSIADDALTSFTANTTNSAIYTICADGSGNSSPEGQFRVRTSPPGAVCRALDRSSGRYGASGDQENVVYTTGVTTVAGATDGKFTISMDGDTLYLINRSGSSQAGSLTPLAFT